MCTQRTSPDGALLAVLGAAAVLFAASPTRAVEGGVPPDSPSARVDANVSTSLFAGVGYVSADGTGAVLDRTHVLTAAHVVYGLDPQTVNITFNLTFTDKASISDLVVSYATAPNFTGFNSTPNDSNDLAVLTLKDPLPDYVPSYQLSTAPLAQGTTLTFVGYGDSGDGVNGYTVGNDGVTKRVGQNNADELDTGDQGPNVNQVFVYDFDGPNNTDGTPQYPNYLGGTTLGNTLEGNIGNGDSGAPAFVKVNGQYQVAGVMDFLDQFQNPDQSNGPDVGKFGSGGGGAIVSAYTGPDGFLAPYAAPEPDPLLVFGLGCVLLGGRTLRRWGTSKTVRRLPQ